MEAKRERKKNLSIVEAIKKDERQRKTAGQLKWLSLPSHLILD